MDSAEVIWVAGIYWISHTFRVHFSFFFVFWLPFGTLGKAQCCFHSHLFYRWSSKCYIFFACDFCDILCYCIWFRVLPTSEHYHNLFKIISVNALELTVNSVLLYAINYRTPAVISFCAELYLCRPEEKEYLQTAMMEGSTVNKSVFQQLRFLLCEWQYVVCDRCPTL